MYTVFIEIADGEKNLPSFASGANSEGVRRWQRKFLTVPRYGDSYSYRYVPKPGEYQNGPAGNQYLTCRAYVIGIDWREHPNDPDQDVPFVIIGEKNPFTDTNRA